MNAESRDLKLRLAMGLFLLAVAASASPASAAGPETERSPVVGRFAGHTIAEAGEIYIFNWESEEFRLDDIRIYNVDTRKHKRIRLNSKGYFLMMLDKGRYQVRVRKTSLQARKTGSKYHIWSRFEVAEGSMVNLGTFMILSSSAQLNLWKVQATYVIQHKEDHDSYQDPLVWLRDRDPGLYERYESRIVCPFPHGPGNPLYERSENPERLAQELFGVLPGCNVEELKRVFDDAGGMVRTAETPNGPVMMGLDILTRLDLPADPFRPMIFTVDKGRVTVMTLIIENPDQGDPAAREQMSTYGQLSARISGLLGESTSDLRKERKADSRLEDLRKGKSRYSTEWNYDIYRVQTVLGNQEVDEEFRDSIFLYVLYVPLLLQ